MVNEAEEEAEQSQYGILFATKSGKIYTYSHQMDTSVLLCDIFPQAKDLAPSKRETISSMVNFRHDSHLLVGTSFGRVFVINLNLQKVVDDVTANCALNLEAVNSVYL